VNHSIVLVTYGKKDILNLEFLSRLFPPNSAPSAALAFLQEPRARDAHRHPGVVAELRAGQQQQQLQLRVHRAGEKRETERIITIKTNYIVDNQLVWSRLWYRLSSSSRS